MSTKLDVGAWGRRRNSDPNPPDTPGIVVIFRGGLGNQMFQRAFGLALTTRGYKVCYNEGWCREYSLNYFENLSFGSVVDPMISEENLPYKVEYLSPTSPSTMMGYWQTEKYFKGLEGQLRQIFKFKPPRSTSPVIQLLTEVQKLNSTFIHVRRQDYIGLQHYHGMQPLDYYKKGIDLIREAHPDAKIFVFSDDRPWCRENFPSDFFVVDGTNKFEDLHLMSLCQHAIIVNSSFSWWGAWLGDNRPGRMVIAPEKWFATPERDSRDIIPERWIKL
jgi:hypothetical protein